MNARETEELLSRARRTETKLTQIALSLGVGSPSIPPAFEISDSTPGMAHINLPSPKCGLQEILDTIPDTWDGPVYIYVGDDFLAELRRG